MSTVSAPVITFSGRPTDIDLLAADAQFEFILNAEDYESEPEKIAYFLSKCRGPALVWAARYLDMNPGLTAEPYPAFLAAVKAAFGYNPQQSGAIARAQLSSLKQTGTLIEFLTTFEDACRQADIQADEPKITMLLDKLKPRYRQIIVESGTIPQNYNRLRMLLANISAMEGQAADLPTIQRRDRKKRSKNSRGAEEPVFKKEAKN